MKKLILFFAVFALMTSAFAGEYTALNSADMPFTSQAIQSDRDNTVIKYSVNGYETDYVMINGKNYTLFEKLRKESVIEEAGMPRLPRINRSVIIPDNGQMSFNIVSSEYIEIQNIDIAPSKGNILRTVDPATVPYTFGDVYNKNEFFPRNLVELGEPYIMRDVRGMVVELNAFQYNPVTRTLRIYTDVTIEVTKTTAGGANVLERSGPLTKLDPQFDMMYKRHFLNYGLLDYPTCFESGGMLIICYDTFMPLLEPLVEWKNQKGIETEMVALSSIGGTTTAIENYIANYYNNYGIGFVLIIGDHQQVPTFSSGSDPVYALITGDNYPELFVGRFSGQNQAEISTQVERTINYEKYPLEAGDWYHKGLGIASNQGPGHHGEYDNTHITLIANKLLNYTYTLVDSCYDYWGTQAIISNNLNNGRSMINYCGHGSTTSWGTTGFSNTSVNNLVNTNMLPYIISVACNNGTFTSTTCFAEAWLRATDPTGAPTGAIGAYMSKISQSWSPPMDAQDEAVDLMVTDSMFTFGGICFNGSNLMIDLNGATGVTEAKNWTIFGDPSLQLRNDTPINYTVNHQPVLLIGTSTFDVTVSGPGGPVNGATVCGMNDEIYAVGMTNAAGQVTLDFTASPVMPGTFALTVTGWNAMTNISEVDIIPPDGPYVVYTAHTIDDDILGNNNGQLDYAEESHLGLTLENVGVELGENIVATISSADPLITIIQNQANFGNIDSNTTATVDHAFQVELSPDVTDGQFIPMIVSATNGVAVWESSFSIIAHAPNVVYSGLTIDDVVGGNGNGSLDPGESATLFVNVTNDGSSGMAGLMASLTSTDPYVTIDSDTLVLYLYFSVGANVDLPFEITVSPSCPQEHHVNFTVDVQDGGVGYAGQTTFNTVVGNIWFAPTGPDNYGYLAYDMYDFPENPVYEWVEISADSGGPGTEIVFTSDDQNLYFTLPFTFTYYGADYDTLTISSNGFIAMGISTDTDYSNSGIPNSDGPSRMIASYWEDMSPQRMNSGGVWSYYDAAEHIYIVEFNHVEQYAPTGDFETFQTILYDPDFYTTITGDGRIKFQYKSMSEAFNDEGTVGIENATETDGIQFLFDGAYDAHAYPVTDGYAVLFTTPTNAPDVEITLTPTVTLPIVIPANGGSFTFDLDLVNNGTNPAFFDGWMEILLPNQTLYPIFLRNGISLGPSGSLFRAMNQNVPGGAPSGDYIYYGRVGIHPDVVYNEDTIDFSKSVTANSAQPNVSDWNIEGWDDESTGAADMTPTAYFMDQNYPNPFNPETSISFGLPSNSRVTLKIYNVLGETVATLLDGTLPGGYYQYKWNANGLSSGLYFYRLEAEGFSQVKKMMLVR